ncbi:NF-kappa-B inhibitor-interacting Ras-like protein 1 isoform X2 [Pantherophis guttatus]|uniref:NF-kappa-B inhibitor-interacting Ras-like protein 1 isoform X2 n=1 Tax=Pantherophis guttatus TaxID=94885 RepID=A0ABM3Z058_PANGU|nr:NF-kappa-B inhibitor-interacting Ras-like protein 1 isoform X2 [Pantherophis guttatus]
MGKGFKVLVCGMRSVGKTAILEQVLYGNHTTGEECSRTMEDVYVAVAETDRGLKEQLRLYDTQGLQGEEDFSKHYYSMADGFVLVYAVNSLESFEKVKWLKKEIGKFREKKEKSLPQKKKIGFVLLLEMDLRPSPTACHKRQFDLDKIIIWGISI